MKQVFPRFISPHKPGVHFAPPDRVPTDPCLGREEGQVPSELITSRVTIDPD